MILPDCPVCGETADHTYRTPTNDRVPICGACATRMIEAKAPGWEMISETLCPSGRGKLTTHKDIAGSWAMRISLTLRTAGLNPLPEAIRVSDGGYVSVSGTDAEPMAETAAGVLTEAGFVVDRITGTKMRVTKERVIR